MRSSRVGSRARCVPSRLTPRPAAGVARTVLLVAVLGTSPVGRPATLAPCPGLFARERGILAELYVAQKCPACIDAQHSLERLTADYPGLVAVLVADRPAPPAEEAVYARREAASREQRRARLGYPVAVQRPHLLLGGEEVVAAGAAPGASGLGPRVAAQSASRAGLAPGLALTVEVLGAESAAPASLRVHVQGVADAPFRGMERKLFFALARTRQLPEGGVIHEISGWQGPQRLPAGGRLTFDLGDVRDWARQSVLVFSQEANGHRVTDVLVVPLCQVRNGPEGRGTIRP